MTGSPRWHPWAGAFAMMFGGLTVLSGGLALLGGSAVQGAVGQAVPFVLWFNTLAGFAYIAAGLAIWRRHPMARALAWGIALATLVVFALFGLAVWRGVGFEPRTVGAMTLRAGVWLALAVALGRR